MKVTRCLYKQLEIVIAGKRFVSQRATPLIAADTSGHFGLTRVQGEWLTRQDDVIGPCGAQRTNSMGRLFVNSCAKFRRAQLVVKCRLDLFLPREKSGERCIGSIAGPSSSMMYANRLRRPIV